MEVVDNPISVKLQHADYGTAIPNPATEYMPLFKARLRSSFSGFYPLKRLCKDKLFVNITELH
jgi:hypothetical protein